MSACVRWAIYIQLSIEAHSYRLVYTLSATGKTLELCSETTECREDRHSSLSFLREDISKASERVRIAIYVNYTAKL